MKKNILSFIIVIIAIACNNADKKQEGSSDHTTKAPKTQADSLMNDVMDGHDIGMGKMSKINKMQKEVKMVLDSIAKLPVKAKYAAAPLKVKLDSLAADLSYAEKAMNKWMDEFNMDSAVNNIDQRIQYLAEEKLKIGKVKIAILRSLQKADSLLKSKL